MLDVNLCIKLTWVTSISSMAILIRIVSRELMALPAINLHSLYSCSINLGGRVINWFVFVVLADGRLGIVAKHLA